MSAPSNQTHSIDQLLSVSVSTDDDSDDVLLCAKLGNQTVAAKAVDRSDVPRDARARSLFIDQFKRAVLDQLCIPQRPVLSQHLSQVVEKDFR